MALSPSVALSRIASITLRAQAARLLRQMEQTHCIVVYHLRKPQQASRLRSQQASASGTLALPAKNEIFMENNNWQAITKIFDEALEQDEHNRTAFIAQACGGDAILRREVESLLRAHQQADNFLLRAVTKSLPAELRNDTAFITSQQRIGPYQLIREIAQGGMGAVWLAERADNQYRQQIAIKLIKAGAGNEDIAHRLRQERQILAALSHPNIARLLDGGTTDSGQPYLVMEYIEGVPMNEYCQQQQLSITARLTLFCQVCAALQYAHQNLVIHRDLKPGNILVTADGTPKLLDFGIAKLQQPDLSQLYQTKTGTHPMTPAYASPEQIRGESLTTASDVYSLGVVLYELLTGRSPYQLKEKNFGELSKAICEQEPTRPSEASKQTQNDERRTMNAEQSAKNLSSSPGSSIHHSSFIIHYSELRGDLDSIVLMALRKEPQARYSSVEQFSADIQRYLDGLPTHARKGTFAYRAVKYVRRHKVPVAAAALIAVSLLGGIGATSRQAKIARAEQVKAEAQRIRAEQALATAEAQRRRAEQALAEIEVERTRAENALTTAEQRRKQAETARIEASQQRTAAETQRLAAEEERNVAQTQRKLAEEQRQRAETQELSNRQLLYTSRMGLAQQAWENSNIERMRELLDFYLPQTNEPDFRGFEWYYLWRLCHREEKTITGGDFRGVAYAPDNKSLLTLAITRNIVEVAFRDVTTWQILSSQLYTDSFGVVAVSRGTDKVVVGLKQEGIHVFSFSDYKELFQIRGLKDLAHVAISPSGKIIAAGFENGKIQLFDAETGEGIRALIGHQQYITTLAFSSDGRTLASGSFDEAVWLWDVATGTEIRSLKQSRSVPNSVTFTPDDKTVIAVCNSELKVWETATGKEIASRSIAPGRPVLALSPDGTTLATVDVQPTIRLWDTQKWEQKAAIKGHGNVVRSLAFSPDGIHLASGSLDQTARIWNVSRNLNDVIKLTDPDNRAGFSKALFTPNGQKIVSGKSRAGLASIWDSISGRKLFDLRGHTKPATVSNYSLELAVSSNSRCIATGGADNLVKVWDAETGREINTISNLPSRPTALAFSPNNNFLAIGTEQAAYIYDLLQGCITSSIAVPLGLNALRFSSDGKTLVTSGDDSIIRFLESATGNELRRIQSHQDKLFVMALSTGDKYLATGSLDSTAAIWDVQTGNQLWLLKGHSSRINSVSFSPDGRRLATSSNDNTLKLWDMTTGQELLTFKDAGGCSVSFSPDGSQLLSACGENLTIWPAATAREVREKY